MACEAGGAEEAPGVSSEGEQEEPGGRGGRSAGMRKDQERRAQKGQSRPSGSMKGLWLLL